MTARDTGAAALAALALRYQHTPPKDAMQHVFGMADGNATAAARDLGVGKKSLMAAVTSLCLAGWLAETWPHRAKGGQGARLPSGSCGACRRTGEVKGIVCAWCNGSGVTG